MTQSRDVDMGAESTFNGMSITAQSFMSREIEPLWDRTYDLSIIATSWDKRCLCITNAQRLFLGHCVMVIPDAKDSIGLRDEHDPKLHDFARLNSKTMEPLNLATGDMGAWPRLRKIFRNFFSENSMPGGARVFIDLSTCPRFLTLGLLKEALLSGLVRSIDFAYSEGIYPPPPASYDGIEEISFRDGPIRAVPIPGFLGDFEPGVDKLIVASIGFDGWKTLNLLTREEPDAVAVLIASPAASPDYELRATRSNAALIQRFLVNEEEMLRARAGDAIAAASVLRRAREVMTGRRNTYYLCAGNKPHSLGLALDAMTSDSVTLLYVKPTRHTPVKVEPSGVFWRYTVSQSVLTNFQA